MPTHFDAQMMAMRTMRMVTPNPVRIRPTTTTTTGTVRRSTGRTTTTTTTTRAGILDAFSGGKHSTAKAAAKSTTTVNPTTNDAPGGISGQRQQNDAVARLERAVAMEAPATQRAKATRKAVMAGNWKLNPKTLDEARTLAALTGAAAREEKGVPGVKPRACEVFVCPPSPFISEVARIVRCLLMRCDATRDETTILSRIAKWRS
jgi:hypothetical protein